MSANAIRILMARPCHTELSLSEANVLYNKVHSPRCKAQAYIWKSDLFFVVVVVKC